MDNRVKIYHRAYWKRQFIGNNPPKVYDGKRYN